MSASAGVLRSVPLVLVPFLLLSCKQEPTPPQPLPEVVTKSSSSAVSETGTGETIRETKNVTYTGTIGVMPSGSEGTHNLITSDGKEIFLESDVTDLNGYVDEEAEVIGSLRPTLSGSGLLLRVERIRLLSEPQAETGTTVVSSASSSAALAVSSAAKATPPPPPPAQTSSAKPVEEEEPDSEKETDPGIAARSAIMAKSDLSAQNWTQQYCTGHIGFCIPVHKNWWFKSFGTTTSTLWHVEINSEEIDSLGDGPIVVNLVSGTLGSRKATDGQVRTENGVVIAFKDWTENRHFEISAPSSLEPAIRYILDHLVAYSEEPAQ